MNRNPAHIVLSAQKRFLRRVISSVYLLVLFFALLAGETLYATIKVSNKKKEEPGKKSESEKDVEAARPAGNPSAESPIAEDPLALGFEETSVLADLNWLDGKEINTMVRDNVAYLSVTDIFNFLKIKNTYSHGMDSITGFFIDESMQYVIDNVHHVIIYNSKTRVMGPSDLIKTETNLYLRSDYFSQIFGLECEFDPYELTVKLNSNQEVPAVFEKKREAIRKNLNKLKGNEHADTTLPRSYPGFHFGMADWFVASEQKGNLVNMRAMLGLGAVVLGGETNVGINVNSNAPFDEKQLYYLWRHVNNENKLVKQVMLGRTSGPVIASVYSPVIGAQVTNRATTYRQAFGTYNITDVTSPNWIVELYVNNVLVDYTRADASGFYSLDVPLVYGTCDVKLRFYGQFGEVQTREQHINIPVSFLPPGEAEYTVSSGIVEDGKNSVFARSVVNYGVSRGMTAGGGLEYLSSITSGNYIPFVTTSLKLFPNVFFYGDYAWGVRGKGVVNYRLPSNIQFELNYTKYTKGQTAVIYNYDQETKASITVPLRLKKVSGITKFTIDQIVLPGGIEQWQGEWLMSSTFSRVNVNLTTYGTMVKQNPESAGSGNLLSSLAVTLTAPFGFMVTPQAMYDYKKNEFISLRCTAAKKVGKNGSLNAGYEFQPLTNTSSATLGFRYDFSAMITSASVYRSSNSTVFSESASGGFIFDRKSDCYKPVNRACVGKAGISVLSFVDVNDNGHYDKGEPRVKGVQIEINGGQKSYSEADTIYHVTDLEPYASYLLHINSDGVENVGWRAKFKAMRVTAAANNLTMVEVPFEIVGEVSGTVGVKMKGALKEKGIGQIIVNVYNKDSVLVAQTLSEGDGYFSYTGLHAGSYFLNIDTAQLRKIDYSSLTGSVPAEIAALIEGDLVDGIRFVVQPNHEPVVKPIAEIKLPVVDKTSVHRRHDNFSILIDATDDPVAAGKLKTKLTRTFRLPVWINAIRDDYIIEIVGFDTREEAEKHLVNVVLHGYKEAIVIRSER